MLVVYSVAGCTKPAVVSPTEARSHLASEAKTAASANNAPDTLAVAPSTESPAIAPEPGLPDATPTELGSSLPIDSFEPAVVRPAEGSERAPLFVITHGAGGNAEWHCQHYAAILGPACTLVCLKGKRMFLNDPSRGYYYPDHIALGREVSGARAALSEHFANRLFMNEAVYAGYSQGASMGVLAVAEHGDWFRRLLLVEGGFDAWSALLARHYAQTGGKRVLFVCGTEHCQKRARQSVSLLQRYGVAAELRYAPGAGHRPDGPVAEKVRDGLRWLLDGSPELSLVHSDLASNPATRDPHNLASPAGGAQ